MQRDTELRLIEQCVDQLRDGRPFISGEERMFSVERYIDPQRFDQELAKLFQPSMNLVAHASELGEPGAFLTRDLLGAPVLLARGEDGTVRAFLNVCRHRGATLETRERGRCKRFVCPYHAWTYDNDGALATVRHAAGFPTLDREAIRLAELPCVEAAGFVWVCPRPRPGSGPEARLRDAGSETVLSELVALGTPQCKVFASHRRVWKANWKLVVDGGLESYHFRVAHKDTVGPYFADNVCPFEMLGDHTRTILPRSTMLELSDRPRDEWNLRKTAHVLYALFPNASLLVQERHFDLIVSTPLSVDETLIEITTLVPDPGPDGFSEKAQRYWAANHAFTRQTLDEDFAIAERIHRGIASGANESFRFGLFEGALSAWHDVIDAKLGDAAKAPALL